MQPTYLPWLGYFDLIDQADCFVFLDTVQFSKRSWQQRNRFKSATGPVWCSVSVHSKGQLEQPIRCVEIDHGQHSLEKHIRTVKHSYGKAKFASLADEFFQLLQAKPKLLVELNIELIRMMCRCFGIQTEFVRSSALSAEGVKAELLVNLCEELGATEYLSALGSKSYIEENDPFPERGIDLAYHKYVHPEYSQLHGEFESHLSALDVLLNEGQQSQRIIRSGRGE